MAVIIPNFVGSGNPLTQGTFDGLIAATDLAPISLWTVLAVESQGYGYLADRRPKILFEKHIFSRLTGNAYDLTNPDISGKYDRNGYGQGGDYQYIRLNEALALDPTAGLKSASWGLAQIMGENAELAGYPGVEEFVLAMVASEDNQLSAMVQFLRSTGALKFLLDFNWDKFALSYNGSDAIKNGYHNKLRECYDRYRADGLPDLKIRTAQVYLTLKGYSPGRIDGIAGDRTAAAVKDYQADVGNHQTGIVDDALVTELSS